jgi:SAM-dependent methyltransferase
LKKNTTVSRVCPICGQKVASVLHTQKFCLFDGHPLVKGYQVVRCTHCGFVRAGVGATQEDYDRFYAQESRYACKQTSTGGATLPWDVHRQELTAKRIAALLQHRDASILDIGCANGGLLDCLKRAGFDHVIGCDPSAECVENTRDLGCDAFVATLGDLLKHDRSYQCVVLSHVMEHVLDIPQAMEALVKVTADGGLLYVEVPDATRYDQYLFVPFQDFNTEHINHFSLMCLENLMVAWGFDPVTAGSLLLQAGPDMPYPAIYGIWRKTHKQGGFNKIVEDKHLVDAISSYIMHSRELMDRLVATLKSAVAQEGRVILWGAGQLCFKLLAEAALHSRTVVAIVDSNPVVQGRSICGIPVLPPEAVAAYPEAIVITSILHQEAIRKTIASDWHLTNKIVLLAP